jgi:L-amino acid N-acyltransferase YncA
LLKHQPDLENLLKVSKALIDPVRLKILLNVHRQGCCQPDQCCNGLSVIELQQELNLAQSKVSYHLKELKDAGLLKEARQGKSNYYTLNQEALELFFLHFTQNLSNQSKFDSFSAEIRSAHVTDIPDILNIYNQGIVDRIATLEDEIKSEEDILEWLFKRDDRYAVIVIEVKDQIVGWASLNPYSHRCAYSGVAELSIYIERNWRGKGIGKKLLSALEEKARQNGFYKIVLFTFPFNQQGQGLYKRLGYREVGIFLNQGKLDGKFVDVMAMEKLL